MYTITKLAEELEVALLKFMSADQLPPRNYIDHIIRRAGDNVRRKDAYDRMQSGIPQDDYWLQEFNIRLRLSDDIPFVTGGECYEASLKLLPLALPFHRGITQLLDPEGLPISLVASQYFHSLSGLRHGGASYRSPIATLEHKLLRVYGPKYEGSMEVYGKMLPGFVANTWANDIPLLINEDQASLILIQAEKELLLPAENKED